MNIWIIKVVLCNTTVMVTSGPVLNVYTNVIFFHVVFPLCFKRAHGEISLKMNDTRIISL